MRYIEIVTEAVSDRLRKAIEQFATEHPDYATVAGATENCRTASSEFCDLLENMGFKNCYVDEIAVVGGMSHRVAFCGSVWVDWTARQYDPRAAFPVVKPKRQRWTHADHLRTDKFEVY